MAECELKRREYQLAHFGRVLPKISGDCWGWCPVRVVKPYYSPEAGRLKISGGVKVETVVDENGKVIYARVLKGSPFLGRAAREAALRSEYSPMRSCNNEPIKFRWIITYNFHLEVSQN